MTDRKRRVKSNRPLNQAPGRLRQRRFAAGMNLTDLAKKAGISIGYLSELESGRYAASARVLGRLAGALGCAVTDLMPDETAKKAA